MNLSETFRFLEINGGVVEQSAVGDDAWRLTIPSVTEGRHYVDAQLDDYGGRKRSDYKWQPTHQTDVMLSLKGRFSLPHDQLTGTAGFGFWNAPFGDPTVPYPALPQATWFFFGSPPNDLPLNPNGEGNGFFAGTLDATTWRALGMAPLAPIVVGLNHIPRFRRSVWPRVQAGLGMSYVDLSDHNLTQWHQFRLEWGIAGSRYWVDDELVLTTTQSPQGPLGFVCWIDNQYMRVTPTGRLGLGTLQSDRSQTLEVKDLCLKLIKKSV